MQLLVARKQNLSGKFWWHLTHPVTHTMVGMTKDLFQTDAYIGSYPDQIVMDYTWDESTVNDEDLYVTPPMQHLVYDTFKVHVLGFLKAGMFPRILGAPSFGEKVEVRLCGFRESPEKWTLYQFEEGFAVEELRKDFNVRTLCQGDISSDPMAFGYAHMNQNVLQVHVQWSKSITANRHACIAQLFNVENPSIRFVNRKEMLWNPEKN